MIYIMKDLGSVLLLLIYNIRTGGVFIMKISLDTTAESFNLEVGKSDRLDNVKVNFKDKPENSNNGSSHQLVLSIQGTMRIFVKNPYSGETYVLDVQSSDTVESVKDKMQQKEGTRRRLIFGGRVLNDRYTLADCNIQKNSTLSYY